MSDKFKSRVKFVAVALVIIVFWVMCLPVPRIVFAPYDAARRALLARRIADADRIVGTYMRSSVTLTLVGDDARRVVQAVSTASSDRPPYGLATSCSFMAEATFCKGTNVLDRILVCGPLFLIHSHPPYKDESGVLDRDFSHPLSQAVYEADLKKVESR